MYSHHPQSSGEKPDASIWHCRACGWRSEATGLRGSSPASRCPECRGALSFIDFHRETETDLMERILAGKA